MKKRVLMLLGAAVMALSLGACKDKKKSNEPEQQQNVQQTFTVAFEVDGTRVATARVKDGEKVTQQIDDPVKTGYVFIGWYEGETKVDLATYVVTHNVTLVAKFEEFQIPEYNINDVKDNSKTYYLVVGWWECTDMQEDGVTPKLTSHLTPATVRLFYYNLRNYLTTIGATEENLNAISFRNYSSGPVADMGAAINADGDVDLIIGVGNNINTTAGVSLHNSSNDYKFQTEMGDPLTARHVACPASASELGVATFEWLKETTAGKDAFKKVLTQAEINASITIDLTVTVHGDGEPVSTHLDDKDDVIQMPTITVPDGKLFKGFAISEGGAVALNVAKDAELKYKDVKNLVANNANTLDLYPVLEDKPQYDEDLMVFIQAGAMSEVEEKLLEARFNFELTTEHVNYTVVTGDAAAYTAAVGTYADVLIGTNELLSTFTADASGALASAGAKHFAGAEAFKVMISEHVVDEHKTLASQFYTFVTQEAKAFEFHYSYWVNANKWVTADERTAINSGVEAEVKTALGVTGSETLAGKYNVSIANYVCEGTKVGDLGNETRALRGGKGTDLIIGCGNNVDATSGTTGGMTLVKDGNGAAMKKSFKKPFFSNADGRYVALVVDNPMARAVYEKYFAVTVTVHGDTEATTVLHGLDALVTMPEITVPSGKVFKGFALTADGEVVLDVEKNAQLKLSDLNAIMTMSSRTVDLYAIIQDKPARLEDVMVYIHGSVNEAELNLLKVRFNQTDKTVNLTVVSGDLDAYTTAVGDYADILIASESDLAGFTADSQGVLADVGAKHFVSSGLKVMIPNVLEEDHRTLAKSLYDFLVAPAAEFILHCTYWTNWIDTTENGELDTMKAGIRSSLNTLFGISGDNALSEKLNINITSVELTQTGVADLGAATNELHTDLVIGCGKNITSTGGVTTIAKDTVSTDFMAAGRYVALITENILARHIYHNYFNIAA